MLNKYKKKYHGHIQYVYAIHTTLDNTMNEKRKINKQTRSKKKNKKSIHKEENQHRIQGEEVTATKLEKKK